MFVGGAVKYRFFPAAELNYVRAQAAFVAGTPREEVAQFAEEMLRALQDTDQRVSAIMGAPMKKTCCVTSRAHAVV